jgi:BirA family biotin operon repressor/biotin-[acetyl-CoA-carboxylase] ligase
MSTDERFETLDPDQLKEGLADVAIIGREIIVLDRTTSTNDAILNIAAHEEAAISSHADLAHEGLVVFAEHQTGGRGQRGNRWESAPSKGLWFSILLRPDIQVSNSGRLTVWAIEAVSDVLCDVFSLEPRVKMPNDVQLNGRKVAGVLVEMRAQRKAPHVAVVGIGINVNQSPDDFPAALQDRAISLAMALDRRVERHNIAVALLRKLDRTYEQRFSKNAVSSSPARTTIRDTPAARFRMA